MIQAEEDPEKFGVLIRELDDFLEKREIRLKQKWANDPMGLNRDDDKKADNELPPFSGPRCAGK